MIHEVKPLRIVFICFLLCSIFHGFFFVVATMCFWALFNVMATRRQIRVWLCTPTEIQSGGKGL